MSTYKELQSQIEKLQKEAEHARKNELANAISDIHNKMRDFGITPEDLGIVGKKKAGKTVRKPVAPKYRNTALVKRGAVVASHQNGWLAGTSCSF